MTRPATIGCGNRVAALLVIAVLGSCSSPPLEFADWIIDVPEGTRIVEYAPVLAEERDPDAIRLTEELVVGADLSRPDEAVFQPGRIVGTAEGTFFVADFATTRLQMYDANGRHIRTLGREGQGPGSFASISWMTIAGDVLVIDDAGNSRWSLWSLDGEHLGEHRKPEGVARRSNAIEGLADGTLVARSSETDDDGDRLRIVTRLDLDGAERLRFDEMVEAPPIIPSSSWTARDVAAAFIELIGQPTRDSEVGAGTILYVTPKDEYQVVAWSPDGASPWALRVASPRPALSSRLKSLLLSRAREMDETVTEAYFDWPAGDDAIVSLRTDGRGRLYVILNEYFDGPSPDRLPADVYDTDGTRIAAGYVPVRWLELSPAGQPAWDHAAGDYVYGLRENEAGEMVAVRYTLVVRPS